MLELSIWHWTLLALGASLTGLAKGGVPGAGIVTVAVFAWVLDQAGIDDGVRRSVGLLLPVLVVADVVAVLIYRRYADWRHLFRLLPWTFLGIIGGYFLFDRLSGDLLKLIIGALLLGLTALRFGKKYLLPRAGSNETSRSELVWGGALGFLLGGATMLANAAGPIAALYLVVMRLPKYAFLGTSAWLFLIVNVSKIPLMVDLEIISFDSMSVSAKLFLPAALGAWMGPWVARRLNQTMFDALVWIFIVVAGVKFIF